MKKMNMPKFATLCLLLVMVCVIAISGTYAKYTTELTGTSGARIAKWAWAINETDIANTTTTYTLELFDTIIDTADGEEETNVVEGLIAPGTEGEFSIKVENKSEVDATYQATFTLTNPAGANLEFSKDKQTWGDISVLNIAATNLDSGAEAVELPVYWRWVFEEDATQNTQDTTVGFTAAGADTNVEVQAVLNLVQRD